MLRACSESKAGVLIKKLVGENWLEKARGGDELALALSFSNGIELAQWPWPLCTSETLRL